MQDLTAERWQRIDRLFEQALDEPPDRRLEWLAGACEGDRALYDAVSRLLANIRNAEGELGESVSDYAETVLAELAGEGAGGPPEESVLPLDGRVGAYRLVEEIGRGGMGAVYLAERGDEEFEKRVALKLVKRGMDTDDILLRFRYERQILATLEHPNIARLYDGGATADGRPYLVMEYIEGVPITRYCDENRLSIDARLRLFADVCRAVQFAHQNLVVHRDIKPSNILVQPDGAVKLLDFGIAKLLDPSLAGPAPETRAELRIFTPEYAAPEQRTGEAAVTTASDVYSLGVLLFELLTGRRPEGAPEGARPSAALGRALTGPSDGTGPVGGLEETARRRGTTPERLRRRLRGDLGSIVSTALAREPARRYASAGHLLAEVERHLAGFPVEARGPSIHYRTVSFVRRHRVGVAAAALVVLSLIGGLGAALWQAGKAARERDQARLERARAEQVSGLLLGIFEAADPLTEERLDTLRARDLVDRGVDRIRNELAGQPGVKASMLATLGRVYVRLGLYDQAEELYEEALQMAHPSSGYERERALALTYLGELADWRGDYATSDSLAAMVLSYYAELGWQPDTIYAQALSWRGLALGRLGRWDEAGAHHEKALALARRWGPGGVKHYASILNNMAAFYLESDEHGRAEPLLLEAIEIERRIYGPGHPQLATTYNNLASSIHYQGRGTEAEPFYREALAIGRQAYGPDHPNVAAYAENLATLLDDLERYGEAEPHYREALRILTATLDPDGLKVAMLRRNLALNRHAIGAYDEAEALLRASKAALETSLGEDHLYTALARVSLGRTLTAKGRAPEALPLLRSGIAVLEDQLPDGHWRIHAARSELGAALAATGDVATAEPLLIESHAALLEQRGPDDYATRDARENLVRFYRARGRPDLAADYDRSAARTQ